MNFAVSIIEQNHRAHAATLSEQVGDEWGRDSPALGNPSHVHDDDAPAIPVKLLSLSFELL